MVTTETLSNKITHGFFRNGIECIPHRRRFCPKRRAIAPTAFIKNMAPFHPLPPKSTASFPSSLGLMAIKVGIPLRIGVFIGGECCCNLVKLDNEEQGNPDPLEGGPQGKGECEGIVSEIPTRSSADLACG
jgi:hypothetical protein